MLHDPSLVGPDFALPDFSWLRDNWMYGTVVSCSALEPAHRTPFHNLVAELDRLSLLPEAQTEVAAVFAAAEGSAGSGGAVRSGVHSSSTIGSRSATSAAAVGENVAGLSAASAASTALHSVSGASQSLGQSIWAAPRCIARSLSRLISLTGLGESSAKKMSGRTHES